MMPSQESTTELSILVPVYNGAKYLRQCLDSLKSQRIENAQFICIDDGSTDETPAILSEYAEADERFVVLTRPNGGYGKAMNAGLARAEGRYVGILESDDWVGEGAFETLVQLAESHGRPDIVKANHYRFIDPEASGESQVASSEPAGDTFVENYPEELCGKVVSPAELGTEGLVLSIPAIWAAIYRRDFLESAHIGFLETPGASFQDTGFVFKAWTACSTAYVTHDGFVRYRTENEGKSTISQGKALCVLDEWASIAEFAGARLADMDSGDSKRLACRLGAKRFQTYDWNLKRIGPSHVKNFVREASVDLRALREEGCLDEELFTAKQWARLNQWIDDPNGFALSAAIGKENRPARKLALKAARRLHRR